MLGGEAIEEIRDFLEWGGGNLGWDHQVRGCGFGGRGLTPSVDPSSLLKMPLLPTVHLLFDSAWLTPQYHLNL